MSLFGSPPDFDFSLSSTLKRNWWIVLARGVLGLIIGFVAFFFPGPTLLSLVTLFALYLIIDGIFAIISAVRAARHQQDWGFLTFEGIVGILAGLSPWLARPYGIGFCRPPRSLGFYLRDAGASRGL